MKLSTSSNLLRNTMFSAISRASDIVFLILMVMAARYLGTKVFGQFSFSFALVSLLEFATDFGLRDYIIREVARDKVKAKNLISNSIALKLFLSFLSIIILVFLAHILTPNLEVRSIIYILTVSMVAKSFKLVLKALLVAHELFGLDASLSIVERFLVFILAGGALLLGFGLTHFAAAFAFANILNLIINFIIVRKLIGGLPLRNIGFLGCKELIWSAMPFGLNAAAIVFYFRIDSIMLGFLRNDVEVGWYNAAYRITEGLIVIPFVLYNVLLPRLSVLFQKSKDSVERLLRRAMKYVLAISIPITILGGIIAEPIILSIYGSSYSNAVTAFQILLLGTASMFLGQILIAAHNSIDRPFISSKCILVSIVINVSLNIFLIPIYGLLGASIATVIADISLFLSLYVFILRGGYRLQVFRSAIRPLLAASFSGLALASIDNGNVFFLMLIGIIVYPVLLLSLRFLDQEEMALIQTLRRSIFLYING